METEFKKPDFSKKDIELRFENNVICIYGTEYGLKKLADLCKQLIEHPNISHIHLESYGILTKESEKGAVAIFPKV